MKKSALLQALGLSALSFVITPSFATSTAAVQSSAASMTISTNQIAYSEQAFQNAEKSGQPFLIAFHKKGCSTCMQQHQALNKVMQEPNIKGMTLLIVSYDNDTKALQHFNVGLPGTLILYKGDKEVSRTDGLVDAAKIKAQLVG